MPERRPPEHDEGEWHLGIEPGERLEAALREHRALLPADPSLERLGTPLYVVTAEHLGWAAITLWALITRLAVLGLRPMTPREAWRALFALDIARHGPAAMGPYPQAGSGWLEPMRAVIFAAFGAGDYSARVISALFGLLLIAAAFGTRRHLGRAGALAFAAMLTLSPTLTYFSRSVAVTTPAAALLLCAVALAFALTDGPDVLKTVGLACAIALGLSATPVLFAVAVMFVAILIVLGIWELIFGRNPMLRFRVWWERRAPAVIFAAAVAVGLFIAFESGFGYRSISTALAFGLWRTIVPIAHPDVPHAIEFYLPALLFYEFLVVILAALGMLAFVLFRIRSRMGAVAFLWTIFSGAFFLIDPAHHPEWLALVIVPAAMLGGAAVDWLHHLEAWRFIRYLLAVLAILCLYVQLLVNFVRYAPDSSEAQWSRHMVLFWNEATTTMQTEQECTHAEHAVTDRATVYFEGTDAVTQWYLRRLDRADNVSASELIVSQSDVARHDGAQTISEFTLEERWDPDLRALNTRVALDYFFTQHAWSDVLGRDARIELHNPTPVEVPSPAPSPVTSETPSATASMPGTESPAATPASTESASPTPTSSATPAATPTPSPAAT
jgi:uncharacterized protein (TIGR03663 family)